MVGLIPKHSPAAVLKALTVLRILLSWNMQQKQIEQEEEYITNKLMKRLDQLKKEKAVLASEVRVSAHGTAYRDISMN